MGRECFERGYVEEIVPWLELHDEGIASRTKSIWRSDRVNATNQSFIVYKVRRQH